MKKVNSILAALGLFSLEKRRLREDLIINVYKHQTGGCKQDGAFFMKAYDRTAVSGHKLKLEKFCLSIRKPFLTVRVTKQWNRLAREDVESGFILGDIQKPPGHGPGQ